jgi:hypothetical protein
VFIVCVTCPTDSFLLWSVHLLLAKIHSTCEYVSLKNVVNVNAFCNSSFDIYIVVEKSLGKSCL